MFEDTAEKLIEQLKSTGLREPGCTACRNPGAHFINHVNAVLGDASNSVKDQTMQGSGDGSNLFVALFYQNLLLLRRIEALENEHNQLTSLIRHHSTQ